MMKDVVKVIVEHPFKAAVVIGAFFGGVSSIVSAVKGTETKPVIQVITEKAPKSEE